MTGLELLKRELRAKNFTKQQIESSRLLPAILDILANNGKENYLKEKEMDEAIREQQFKIKDYCYQIMNYQRLVADLRKECEEAQKTKNSFLSQLDAVCKERQDYLEGLLEKINSCADQATKNTISKAQAFLQMTNIQTKYDNTAFIIGLASILSNGGVDAIGEMQKINPQITSSSVRAKQDEAIWQNAKEVK